MTQPHEKSSSLYDAMKHALNLLPTTPELVALGFQPEAAELLRKNIQSLGDICTAGEGSVESRCARVNDVLVGAFRFLGDTSSSLENSHQFVKALYAVYEICKEVLSPSPASPAQWGVGPGTQVWIGKPKNPLPQALRDVLRDIVRQSGDVLFAYVPQIYVAGHIDPARQVLYLVLRDAARERVAVIMKTIGSRIHDRWPKGEFIDMLPAFSDHSWLNDVIRTGCFLAANNEELHRRCVERAHRSGPTAAGQAQENEASESLDARDRIAGALGKLRRMLEEHPSGEALGVTRWKAELLAQKFAKLHGEVTSNPMPQRELNARIASGMRDGFKLLGEYGDVDSEGCLVKEMVKVHDLAEALSES
jgi:hypothetical protein